MSSHVNSKVVSRKPSLVHINLSRGNIIKSYELEELCPISRQYGLDFVQLGKFKVAEGNCSIWVC